jgi:hypothetical protein
VILGLLLAAAAVTPCDLTRRPELAEGPVVLEATYASTYHGAFLYDAACPDGDSPMDVVCDPMMEGGECQRGMASIAAALGREQDARARVKVEGSVEPWDGHGFGHLGGFRTQFRISRVQAASRVDPSMPWPAFSRGTFLGLVDEVRTRNAAVVAALALTAESRAGVLPDGFELQSSITGRLSRAQVLSMRTPCAADRWSSSSRIFVGRAVAWVEGSVGCGDAAPARRYSLTYVKNEGKWQPVIGEVDWADAGPSSSPGSE